MKTAKVFYQQILAGKLIEMEEGYLFTYESSYLECPDAYPISLTLPLTKEPYESKVLFSFFDGLIPEGWLLDIATDYWKVNPNDRFELLLKLCGDTIGAVSIMPE